MADKKLQKELSLNRKAGPFEKHPFLNFRISPLGVVPEKIVYSFKIIHDLSYPKENSVNSYIPFEFRTVKHENY